MRASTQGGSVPPTGQLSLCVYGGAGEQQDSSSVHACVHLNYSWPWTVCTRLHLPDCICTALQRNAGVQSQARLDPEPKSSRPHAQGHPSPRLAALEAAICKADCAVCDRRLSQQLSLSSLSSSAVR